MSASDDLGRFKFAWGDGPRSAVWSWRVGMTEEGDMVYHFLEMFEWEDVIPTWEEPPARYNCTASAVHPLLSDAEGVREALNCCGVTSLFEEYWEARNPAAWDVLAESLYSYGRRATFFDENGNNWRKLVTEAKRESLAASANTSYLERTYNRLGQTFRELLSGDMVSTLRRTASMEPGPHRASLEAFAQAYVASGGKRLSGTVSPEFMEACHSLLNQEEQS